MFYTCFLLYTKETQIIIVAVASVSLFVSLLLGGIIYFVFAYKRKHQLHKKELQLQQLEFAQQILKAQIETQENTLTTLGKELHDNVAQLLSSTKMLLAFTERTLENPPESLKIADETLAKAIDELRSLSKALSKDWLQQFSIVENLQTEINRLNLNSELIFNLQLPTAISLNSDKQLVLFRVIQEAIQNAIKHAKATKIDIHIHENAKYIFVNIMDNGIGIKEESLNNGLGTINMKNRILTLQGNIQWHLLPTAGTKISIELPIEKTDYL